MDLSITLSERLNKLRESTDTSMVSTDLSPTPLSTFITLYNKATDIYHPDPNVPIIKGSCYTNYMEGAKILYKWLSPVTIPEIDPALLPSYTPELLDSYAINQLCDIITPYSQKTYPNIQDYFILHKHLKRVIVYLTMQDIMK